MDALGQLLSSVVILIAISLCSKEARHTQKYQNLFRIFALVLAIALSVRYLLWRGIYTLTYSDFFSMIAVWLLFGAEIYAGITSVLGAIVNAFPLSRPLLTLEGMDKSALPSVDVMIPSYNEDEGILEVTIRAAKMLDYPKEKLRVHLLDDGGTDQKINAQNPVAAAAATGLEQNMPSAQAEKDYNKAVNKVVGRRLAQKWTCKPLLYALTAQPHRIELRCVAQHKVMHTLQRQSKNSNVQKDLEMIWKMIHEENSRVKPGATSRLIQKLVSSIKHE